MAFLLARKVKMAQQWAGDVAVPVTVLAVEPCTVTQVRTNDRDGYAAVQVGAGARKRWTKAMTGHVRGLGMFRWLREFREDGASPAVGDRIDASTFKPGDRIQVSGVSKGKGFAGVMKRHHFHGQDASHGTKHAHREPGSIGGGGRHGKGHVIKGMRMAGRMGNDRVTVKGLEVVAVDPGRNELVVKGAVPGARGALLEVRTYEGHWK
ncbi:50S ribosomal protein L3 [Candidatus Uhrbacteria bacterium]|nr:50S ribosomal protein L3 [Candidatus Uhrbacteria bacterium]